jgi:hypothetical protein
MLYGFMEKRAQKLIAAVRRPYNLYGPLNAPFSSIFELLYELLQRNKCCRTKIRTVRIFLSCWLPRNPCPSFALEFVPLLCCFLFSEKIETFSSLALSQSLNLSWKE